MPPKIGAGALSVEKRGRVTKKIQSLFDIIETPHPPIAHGDSGPLWLRHIPMEGKVNVTDIYAHDFFIKLKYARHK